MRESIGNEGLLKMLHHFEDKTARAECRIGLKFPHKDPVIFVGSMPGTIVPARGSNDFLWDSIFQPEGHQLTYAELPPAEKNQISDRAIAIASLLSYFTSSPS